MATNTGGGTTASLSNTPQAKDDTINLLEDYNSIAWLDVMANDLGGNAKILWSLDDTAADGSADLIGSDIGKIEATTTDTSLYGAKIWICDGKVGYDAATLSASFKAALQALAVGQTLSDSFTYAIRMSNGTLSWATAQVVYTGTNDAPDISVAAGDNAAVCLTETNATLAASGTLTVVDPDTTDTVAMSVSGFAKSGNAGTLTDVQLKAMLALTESSLAANAGTTNNLHWSFGSTPETFDYLAAGESLTLTFTIKADDGNGGVDTQTITVKIDGTNDGPAIVAGGTVDGAVEEESGIYTASGSFGFTDVDSSDAHSVSVTPGGLGYVGTLTPSVSDDSTNDGTGTVSWDFSVDNDALQFLAEGETRTQDYTITVDDGHGGTTSQTVQIVLTGDQDPVVITSAAQSESISEDGTNVGGAITFNDVDLSDTHTASAAANPANTTSLGSFNIDPSVTEAVDAANGSLGWSYTVDNSAANYLAVGESVVEKYDVTFNDAHGSIVTETVTVTITGSNDGPDIRAEAGDSAGHAFDETNAGLSTAGTLTVTDPDNSDTVDTSVANLAISGNQGALSDGDLLAMFSITSGDIDLAADSADANNLGWSFDSDSEAFDFVAQDQVLTLTYTLTSDDGHGGTDSQDVTITITGTNDTPELSASVTDHTFVDSAADDSFSNLTGTLSTVDPDSGDTATYSVSGGVLDNSLVGYDTSSTSPYGTLYLNSSSGAYEFVPDDTAIEALKTDDSVGFTLTVTDSQGASDSATLTINIDGANDTPELSATLTEATFTDTAGDDSFGAVNGDLSSTDRDSPDSASYSVLGGSADISLPGYDTSKVTAFGTLYVDSASGNYTFVPDDAAIEGLKTSASLFFTLQVTDGSGATDNETLTINLDGVNDDPELGAVTDASYDDTSADDSFGGVTGTLTSSDRDASETATYSVDGGVVSAELGFDQEVATAYGTLYLDSATGDYKFVPNDGAIEGLKTTDTVDFTVNVTDGSGASDSDTLTITLNGVNDTPELGAVTDASYDDTSADDSFADVTGTLTSSDRDSGDSASYSVDGGVGSAEFGFDQEVVTAFGTLYLDSATGNYKFVPNDAAIEGLKTTDTVDFTVNVTDGSGASDSDTLTITLNGVNDTPEAPPTNSVTTDEDEESSPVAIGASDRDDGEVLTYSVKTGEGPAIGIVSFNQGAGTFTYTPDPDANGPDSFTILVTDASGATTEQVVSVTVNPVNDAPVSGGPSSASGTENDALISGSVPAASDVDGDTLTYHLVAGSVLIDGNPAPDGTVTFNANGSYSYAPTAGDQGLDDGESHVITFDYVANDGTVNSAAAGVTITVNGMNDAPALTGAAAVLAAGSEDNAYTVTLAQLLQGWTDVDVETLSVTGFTASNGSVVANGDGSYTITPTANYNGPVTLNYNVTDGTASVAASLGYSLAAVNDLAVISGAVSGSVTEDAVPNTVGGDLNSTDVDGVNDSWNAVVAATASTNGYGTYTMDAAGNWVYALNNANATVNALNNGGTLLDSFTVTTADGTAQVVNITINGHTDVVGVTLPPTFTGTGDPNDFDTLVGGAPTSGNFNGTTGNDVLTGDGGSQNISGNNGDDVIYGGGGNDNINGNNDNDTLYGQGGTDTVDGNGGLDTLYGGSGNDAVTGSNENDTLYGGSGNDTLNGGNNNDLIIGGYGADQLSGGGGNDTFIYLDLKDTNDTITDFTAGSDKIDFSAIDANSALGGDQGFAFGGTTATANGVWYAQVGGNVVVYVDTDGNAGTAELSVTLTGVTTVGSGDFLLGP